MSMTRKELIDYCNGRNGYCSDDCPYDTRECNVFLAKYKDTPYLSNKDQPELYTDDTIEAEASMTLKKSDNEIPFKNDLDSIINDYEMRGDHKVVELLNELIERRKLPEIIYCKDCKYNVSSHKCLNPESFFLVPDDDFYCGYAERRVNEDNKIRK